MIRQSKIRMIDESEETQDKFPIRELSARTQVNTVTLRAWERRYGLLKPERTAKGHRLYSEDDVVAIGRILALVARGVPLGKVKPLLLDKLPLDGSLLNDVPEVSQSEGSENWQDSINELIVSVELFSATKVERLIHEALANYPVPVCRSCLIEPVFAELAQRDDDGAAFGFAESELVRYTLLRLSAKVTKKKRVNLVTLIAGSHAPIWRLALMALELKDAAFSVHLLNREFTVAAGIEIARQSKEGYAVFYQDGVWKDKEQALVSAELVENHRLFMMGTAPVLTQLLIGERVFADISDCFDGLLKLVSEKGE